MTRNIYSLFRHGYLGDGEELPEGYELLKENYNPPQPPGTTSLEERILRLEIGSLYKSCTHRLIQIYDQEQEIPKLISSVQDLVAVLSSQQQASEAPGVPEAFGVEEAARRLDCSPQQVRELAHEGKLPHHWQGKNLKFRTADLEAFWASETTAGTNKKKMKPKRSKGDDKGRVRAKPVVTSEDQGQVPSAKDMEDLWR